MFWKSACFTEEYKNVCLYTMLTNRLQQTTEITEEPKVKYVSRRFGIKTNHYIVKQMLLSGIYY